MRKSIGGGAVKALMALLAVIPMTMIGAIPAQAEESPYQPDITSLTTISVSQDIPALTEKGAYRLEAIPLAGYASASETMTCLTPYPGYRDTPCTDDIPENLREYGIEDVRMHPIADASVLLDAMPTDFRTHADPGNPFQSVADATAKGDVSDDMQAFAENLAASNGLPAPAATFSTGDGDGFTGLAPGAYLIRTSADSPHASTPAIVFTEIAPNVPTDNSWIGTWGNGSYYLGKPSAADLMDKPIAAVDAKPTTGASIGQTVRVSISQTLHSSHLNKGMLQAALSKGLAWAGNEEVSIDGKRLKALDAQPDENGDLPEDTADGDYLIAHDGSTATATFGQVWDAGGESPYWGTDWGLALPDSDKPIVVSFSFDAILDKGAVIGRDGNPVAPAGVFAGATGAPEARASSAETENDGQDDGLMHGDPAIVYTGALDLKKTDLNGRALDGAQFSLNRKGTDEAMTFVKDGSRLIPDANGQNVLNGNATHIEGLDGDFTLRETKAPEGYALDGRSFAITIRTDANGIHVTTDKADRIGADGTAVALADAKTPAPTQPKPEQSARLAQTGAGGVMPLLAIGLLLSCAGATIPLARRMR